MAEHFLNLLELPKHYASQSETGNAVFNFAVTDISNKTGIDLLYGSDIGANFEFEKNMDRNCCFEYPVFMRG